MDYFQKQLRTGKYCLFVCLLLFLFPIKNYATPLDRLDVNGYFSFEYEKNIGGDDEGDLKGSFDADLIDLVFNFRATDRLRIALDLTWEHGTATEDKRGNAAVEYAFAEYTFSDLVKVRAGKQFTNFGIYNEIHTAKPATLTVKEPLSTNKNNKLGSEYRFYPRWNNGISAVGNTDVKLGELDYVVQILNGDADDDDGSNPFEEDSNTHKAFNARVRISTESDIRYGLSYYIDSIDVGAEEVGLESIGFQFEVANIGFQTGIEFEVVFGTEEYEQTSDIDRNAFTLMVFNSVNSWLTPYLRYEYLDPNDDVSNDEANISIVGVNILFDGNAYLKFEVNHIETQERNNDFSGADFTEFKASISIGF
ncbi:MAG: hypothetical protein JKY66_09180 [Spongiibacteraceae bacterium]|nr:hypothetical protein [Spongiibacteraceae bacterium]